MVRSSASQYPGMGRSQTYLCTRYRENTSLNGDSVCSGFNDRHDERRLSGCCSWRLRQPAGMPGSSRRTTGQRGMLASEANHSQRRPVSTLKGERMHKECGYCRKPIESGKEVKSTILYFRGRYLARKEKEYCSKQCAEYDQMAHEA